MRTLNQIEVAWKLHLTGMSPDQIASTVSVHRATVYRWIVGINRAGCLRDFLKRYKEAKKRTRKSQLHPNVELLLVQKRKETSWCGQKLVWWLREKKGLSVSVAQAYRLLAKHFKLRGAWQKWVRRPPLPKATKPREVIQVDKIDCGELWVHNFIDCFTREVVSVVVETQDSWDAAEALRYAMQYFRHTIWIQTDNGSEYRWFFEKEAKLWSDHQRKIRPGQKEENGFVESFNRTLRRECVGWGKYQKADLPRLQDRINQYLDQYHTERPHLGLNLKTPQEVWLSHLT